MTASPTPQNLASSSMPSSLMTVLSTSKHTASALRKSSFVCERVVMVLQRSSGTVGKTHKAATYRRNRFSSGRFRPFNEALKAMDVFGAVKHQTRPPHPQLKQPCGNVFAHTPLISTKGKNVSRCSHVGGETGLRKNVLLI